MSITVCDYQAEARAAMEAAATASGELERFEWLFLALAWQALARCHDNNDEAFQQDAPAPSSAGNQPTR